MFCFVDVSDATAAVVTALAGETWVMTCCSYIPKIKAWPTPEAQRKTPWNERRKQTIFHFPSRHSNSIKNCHWFFPFGRYFVRWMDGWCKYLPWNDCWHRSSRRVDGAACRRRTILRISPLTLVHEIVGSIAVSFDSTRSVTAVTWSTNQPTKANAPTITITITRTTTTTT